MRNESLPAAPTVSEQKGVPTACVLCSHNCGLRVDVFNDRIVAVRADRTNPITRGYICNRAWSIPYYAHHEERVEYPLRRRSDGGFERIGWGEAIREIATKLQMIRTRHSPRAIGLVGVGGQANHLDAPYALGFLHGLGSARWFNAFAQEKTQHFLIDQWMFDTPPETLLYPDDCNARYLLVLGSNPRISHRGHNATETLGAIARDPNRTLVVADPRRSETARGANIHLQVKPGSDCYLLLGLVALIIQRKLYNSASVRDRTIGFETVRQSLQDVDVADMASRCGIEESVLVGVAEGLSASGASSILTDLGVEQAPFSTLNAYLIRLLIVLTGNLGRRGGNVFYETFLPPGPRRNRCAEVEQAVVSGISAIQAITASGMFSPSLVPEEVLTQHPQRLRALIVEAANPLVSYADTQSWRRALAALDLLVVIDPAFTETARVADYVLPAPVAYEKWEICLYAKHHPEIHTQLRPPVVEGPPEALPEAEIYARLAEAMDLFGAPPRLLKAIAPRADRPWARMVLLLVGRIAARLRVSGLGQDHYLLYWLYRTLGAHLPAPALTAVWLLCFKNAHHRRRSVLRTLGRAWRMRSSIAVTEELFRRILAHPEGIEVARLSEEENVRQHVGFRDKRVRLAPEPMMAEIHRALEASPVCDDEYPLVLSSGVRTPWTANTLLRNPAWRKGKGPHCALFVSESDAERLGVREGHCVRLETRWGEVELPALIDNRLPPGFVVLPNGFGTRWRGQNVGINLNELTGAEDRDPFTGCPHHKHIPCRVSLCGTGAAPRSGKA